MPARGRHSRRKKRIRDKEKKAADQRAQHTRPVSADRGHTSGCSVCHRSDQPAFRCSSHNICDLCLKARGAVSNRGCPLCPADSLSSRVVFAINKVKNLWLAASSDQQAQSDAPPCSIHTTQTLEFLCQQCDVLVCPYCKLAEHEGHETRSLSLVMADAKQRIADARSTRLNNFQSRLHSAQRENKNRRKEFRRTRKTAKQAIYNRHAQLTDIVNKYRDSALRELEAMSASVESSLKEDEARLNKELNIVADLQERIDQTIADSDIRNVLSVDRELQADWSCENIMVRRSVAFPSIAYKVEHQSGRSSPFYTESVRNRGQGADTTVGVKFEKFVDSFIGQPVLNKTDLPKMPLDVNVKLMFQCCQDPEAFVLSVCPTGAEKVAVSYSTSPDYREGVTKSFFEDGRPSKVFDYGLCTLIGQENGMFRPFKFQFQIRYLGLCGRSICSKSGRNQGLMNVQNEGWNLFSYFRMPFPLCKITDRVFPGNILPLSCDAVAPLNFDATNNGNLVAIVDVGDQEMSSFDRISNSTNRVVKMISISDEFYCVHTYEPPSPDFVPSDVCFFSLKGHTVLLVSDMGANSIHVLSIHPTIIEGRLFQNCQFQRYLIADCDMLKQPTALNTDAKGRLWVACKGGQLLTVEVLQ